jgi:hypothetical protein
MAAPLEHLDHAAIMRTKFTVDRVSFVEGEPGA